MRSLLRILAPVVAAASIALAGGAPAVLAGSGSAASAYRYSLDESWCFDDSPGYLYCFDVDGVAQFVDNKAGSSVTITARTRTAVYDGDALVANVFDVELIRGVYQADGTVVTQDVSFSKVRADGQTCHYQAVLRIADYRLVVDHVSYGCGG